MKIITHSGVAHRDDFLSVCLLLHKYPKAAVKRVFPVSEKDVGKGDIVVDVGRRYEPGRWYDHHQDPSLPCSLVLVLRDEFGLSDQLPKEIAWVDLADRLGPHKARMAYRFSAGGGPVEKAILELFSEREHLKGRDPLHKVMRGIGRSLLASIERGRRVQAATVVELGRGEGRTNAVNFYIDGPYAVAFTDIDCRVSDLVDLAEVRGLELVGVVMRSEREPDKTTLISVGGNPFFNPGATSLPTSFIHNSGFLAVVDVPYAEVLRNYRRVVSEALNV